MLIPNNHQLFNENPLIKCRGKLVYFRRHFAELIYLYVLANDHPLEVLEFQQNMNKYVIINVIVGVVILVSVFLQLICWEFSSERRIKGLRKLFFSQMIRQDVSWFDTNDEGNMANKLSDDLEKLRDGTGHKFSMILQYVTTFFVSLGACLCLSVELTLISAVFIPIIVGLSIYCGKLSADSAVTEQERYAVAGAVAEETLSNIRTVIAFDGQSREIERYGHALKEGYAVSMTKYNKIALCTGISLALATIISDVVFWYWSEFMRGQNISPGSVMTIFLLMPGVPYYVILVQPFLDSIGGCLGISNAIHEVISRKSDIDSYSKKGTKLLQLPGRIEFKNVHFSYPSRLTSPILKGLNLTAEPGQIVAIVGPSGTGKSTIISLILRFYDTLRGQVLIDGIPISEYNVKWLRSQIGLVSQEPVLFGMSIADNIALGRENASIGEIIEAAKKANAHDFIQKFPKAYDTLVGDTGTQLSGGQKQRIAIARALIRNPRILLLDEATSALDSVSESTVQAALETAMEGRTTIIIAHRLSTIRKADLIYVLQDGVVLEKGNHNELIENHSLYHNLAMTQQSSSRKLIDEDGREMKSTNDETVLLTNNEIENELSSIGKDDIKKKSSETKKSTRSPESDFEDIFIENEDYCDDVGKNGNRSIQPEKMAKSFSSLEFLKLHKPEWKHLFIGFIGCMGVGLRWTAIGFFSGQLIPLFSLTEDNLIGAATSYNIFFVVLAVLSAILSYMQDKGMTEASKKLITRTRLLVFENLLRQPAAWFDQETSSPGILVNRLARTAPLIEAASGLRVAQVIATSATLFSGFLIAFLYSWKLTLVMFLCILVMAGVAYMQQRMQAKHQLRDANLFDTAGRVALETVRNIRTVKALGQEALFTENYMKHLELPYKEARKQALQSSLLNATAYSITPFMFALALEVGGYLFTNGEIQLEDISKVYFSIIFSSSMLMFIISYLQDNMKARTAMKLLNYLLTRKSQLDGTALTGYKAEIKGNVEFNDVHFSYPTRPDVKVLKGLSFTIEAGKTLAFVGESGSGKSTVISLLERYYDADSGMIQIDGYDIKTLNTSHLRSNIGLITQEPVLFNLTIKDNITYGTASKQTSITFDDIQEAAKIANAHEFVMALPHRYDTIAGERGVQLSGGEKQRVAIARALIHNPRILLMDEATSALDSKSEQIVQAALNNAKQGRTCIIVAHRLSTIQNVDKICVISKGRIVENGTHEELQKLKGYYYNLIKKQLS